MNALRYVRTAAVLFLTLLVLTLDSGAADNPVPLPPSPPRPDAEAGPTKISVALWITDVSKIDSVAQNFTASIVLFLRWHDSRLARSEPGIKQYSTDEVWHPQWLIVNECGKAEHSLPEKITVTPDGNAIYHQRLVGTFSQALDLSRFPFDQGTFRIHLIVTGHRPADIQFVPEETAIAAGIPEGMGIAPQLSLPDWHVLSTAAHPLPYCTTPNLEVAGYAFEFTAARNSQHFIIKVILPLLFIVMMSWAVFWIEPSDAGPQISVAVTTMLTLIAYRFALDSEVPKLLYVTRMDAFVLTSTLLVFLSLFEVLITTKLAAAGRLPLARRVDFHARWVFPAIFTVLSLVIFLRP
ncbi:MAG TPA: hypothetical protein VG796_19735 [Verrucomicrobiales bacterium]|nr:hypothetical protein [Verrucomicrobiales bacterium]